MTTSAAQDKRYAGLGSQYEQMSGYILLLATDGIVAAPGGGQANATQLNAQLNRITTCATAGNSVKLPMALPGMRLEIIHHGAQPAQIFGLGTDTINDVAFATGVSMVASSTATFACSSLGQWYVEGLGSGYSTTGFPTVTAAGPLTATPAGTQGTSLLLTAVYNRVTVVATAGDSVKLPAALAGMSIVVCNDQVVNAMGVWPNAGDSINNAGANLVFSVPATTDAAVFFCAQTGFWGANI